MLRATRAAPCYGDRRDGTSDSPCCEPESRGRKSGSRAPPSDPEADLRGQPTPLPTDPDPEATRPDPLAED